MKAIGISSWVIVYLLMMVGHETGGFLIWTDRSFDRKLRLYQLINRLIPTENIPIFEKLLLKLMIHEACSSIKMQDDNLVG